jgi:putative transposase
MRTYQRWTEEGAVKTDERPTAARPTPANKLSEQERKRLLEVANSPEFSSLPPSQIVPALADKGQYLASEATFYRVLKEADQLQHRGRSKARKPRPLSTHCATAPNQVWCWDITYCAGPIKGVYFYLYLMMDLFSRKIVGFEIHEEESADHAAKLIQKAVLSEGICGKPLVLHSDNGSPMKGATMLATLDRLGVTSSFSRPRVSNDNAFSESLFRTCKYRPDYPVKGFASLAEAREWVLKFSRWYNGEHKHSGLKFVTPNQRHTGNDKPVVEKRIKVYEQAKKRNPARWKGDIRNWVLPEEVWLNPEKATKDELAKGAA